MKSCKNIKSLSVELHLHTSAKLCIGLLPDRPPLFILHSFIKPQSASENGQRNAMHMLCKLVHLHQHSCCSVSSVPHGVYALPTNRSAIFNSKIMMVCQTEQEYRGYGYYLKPCNQSGNNNNIVTSS